MTAPEQLYRTTTGAFAHLRRCPHLRDKQLVEVPADGGFPVCSVCQAEIRGEGRVYKPALSDALAELGMAASNRPLVDGLLKDTVWDQQYLPQSYSYVALTLDDRTVAWIGKGYVDWTDGRTEWLPTFREGTGGGRPLEEAWGDVCPTCNEQRSLSGACGCD